MKILIKTLEFKNENKDTISIYCEMFLESIGRQVRADYRIVDIGIIPYRKRIEKFISHSIRDRYEYRILPYDGIERKNYVKSEFLKYVTEEQMTQAIANLYDMIKPTEENTQYWVR